MSEGSDRLERELKKALQRVEPPAGFAERVLARAAREEASSAQPRAWFRWFGMSGLRWAVACALCLALAGSAVLYRHQRQEKGEQAKEQVMLALQITSSKLRIASESVQQISGPEQPVRSEEP